MQKKLAEFYRNAFRDYFQAVYNILIFLPYYFSVLSLFKTLFNPWKHLVTKKSGRGLNLDEIVSRLSFNCISRGIGFCIRLTVLFIYVLIQIFVLMALPFITIVYLCALPLLFVFHLLQKSEEEKKNKLRDAFLSTHLLKKENKQTVEIWFESYYKKHIRHARWWKVSQLFSIPPIGRDWSVGYTPRLDEFIQDLNVSSYQAHLNNIVDRQKEILEIEHILTKSQESNVLVVGEEGVGKHTIIDALAKKVYEGKTSHELMYKRILKLNMEKILTRFTDQKQRESFFEELLEEAKEAENTIIFIENIDKYVATGINRIDFSISLEKYAKDPQTQIIGVTSPFNYEKYIFPNDKLRRYFTKVDVKEIAKEEALILLLDTAYYYEKKYKLSISFEALKNIIEKSDYYITYIPFPEKAIDLLDNTCAYVKTALKHHLVTPEIVDAVLEEKTHIPTRLTNQMKQKLLSLEQTLKEQIIDQDNAMLSVATTLQRTYLLMNHRKKSIASFLFLGPTGVGKTQTAKTLTQILFGSIRYLLRYDMSNFQSQQDIPQLIGSSQTGQPGLLTQAIREEPYAVLLLDEIEKAHKDLINIFLTLLDEGYFTDGYGKRVDCKNLIVVATSNANQEKIEEFFSPEFLNRFDALIEFKVLTESSAQKIALKVGADIKKDIYSQRKIKLTIAESFISNAVKKAYNPQFGARDVERIVKQEVENYVAKKFFQKDLKENSELTIE